MNNPESHKCLGKDELLSTTKANIEKFGLQVIMVEGTSYLPPFAYSIGLWEKYHQPELICFGLPEGLGHAIINDVAEMVKNGENIRANTDYTEIFKDAKATFLEVDQRNIKDYFGAAINYYNNSDFQALQLIWTDRQNKYPWEESFEEVYFRKQPLLDRNAEFKFLEPRNLATYTMRQWRDDNQPILLVSHDLNGEWQFLTDDAEMGNGLVVCLEDIIKKDLTLNELFDLGYGEAAERDAVGDTWRRMKSEE